MYNLHQMATEALNLDHIRTTAEAYQDKLTAEIKSKEEAGQLAREQERLRNTNERLGVFGDAQRVLITLQVSEALEAIRSEVWKEGHVKSGRGVQSQDSFVRHGAIPGGVIAKVELISDPYPVLLLHNTLLSGKDLTAAIIDKQTVLSVAVPVPTLEGKTLVMVEERGLHYVTSQNNPLYPLVTKAVRECGLRRGIEDFIQYNDWKVSEHSLGDIDTSAKYAKEKLFYLLWQCVQSSRQQNNLPSEIRTCVQDLVRQLPQELQDTGKISPKALRHWGNRIRGGSRLGAVLFDFQDWIKF